MKAAFLVGPRQFEVRNLEPPAPGPGQVVVDVTGCGVCGSNLHDWHRPQNPLLALPGAFGHEISGRVAAVGEDTTGWAPGDELVVQPSDVGGCHECAACREGASWFCERKQPVFGYGFAEQMLVPVGAIRRLPAGLPLSAAPLVEPVACGVHAVRASYTARESGRVDGRTVVVIGAGMLGLSAVIAARALGAAAIVAVARHPHQAAAAHACGADEVLAADADDLTSTLRRRRPELVIEAVGGNAGTLGLAGAVVSWRGEIVCLGGFTEPQKIDAAKFLNRETRLAFVVSYGGRDGVDDFSVAIDMLASGRFPLDELVTHRFPLDAVADAFRAADDKHSGAIRVVVGTGV